MKLLQIILLSVLVPLYVSCNKLDNIKTEGEVVDINAVNKEYHIRPLVHISTKASDTGNSVPGDTDIRNLCLYVISVRDGGKSESNKNFSYANSILARINFDSFSREGVDSENNTLYISDATKAVSNVDLGERYYFIAIANYPSDFSFPDNIEDLKNLETETIEDGGYLMMSSDDILLANFTQSNSKEATPLMVSLYLSRLSAKVSVKRETFGKEFTVPAINFAGEPENPGEDRIRIIGAALANNYQIPTYVFPRSAVNETSAHKLFDKNLHGTSDKYFVDPNTFNIQNKMGLADFQTSNGYYVTSPDEKYTWKTSAEQDYEFLSYVRENNASYSGAEKFYRFYAPAILFKAEYYASNLGPDLRTFYEYKGVFYRNNPGSEEYGLTDVDTSLIHEYTNGICYYIGWIITYSTDNNSLSNINVNEVGTLRNSDYKFSVSGISTIGTHLPSPLKNKYYDLNVNIISEIDVANELIFE